MSERDAWTETNQRQLAADLTRIKALLERRPGEAAALPDADPVAPTLAALCQAFGLSPFERDLLLLCAGMELDASFAGLCASAHGQPYPTFGLALAALPEAHWSALTPSAPLRYWRLLGLLPGAGLAASQLRIDERVLHFLTGVHHLDEQLMGIVAPVPVSGDLVPSQEHLAERILSIWTDSRKERAPAIQLCGGERAGQRAIAARACVAAGIGLYRLDAQVLPVGPHDRDMFQRLWEREAVLSGSALLLDTHALEPADTDRHAAVSHLIDTMGTPLLVMGRERRRGQERPLLTFDVETPSAAEQRRLWRLALGELAPGLNGTIDRLTAQFHLSAPAIAAASLQAAPVRSDPAALAAELWRACREQARPKLDDLARRIVPVATWDDLVLAERELSILSDIAAHVRQRQTVFERWGFAARSPRGLGLSALFVGPSGTGKTLAAEVLASELDLDLYMIDLSQVVSKYIGETEKNLARVFDAAEAGGAILLFDEADALFGKRSDVKDSHDRYANIEVSYLLQRMEAYRGLAILTTNMREALDNAFLRRLRFVVTFRFPDAEQRAAIWHRIFPPQTPTGNLDWARLAQLNVAGGNIRNIALGAAFYAASDNEPVSMRHVHRAAQAEYAKLEKTLSGTETRGWQDAD